jgi:hypothetical protein
MRCQSCNYAELGSKVGSAPVKVEAAWEDFGTAYYAMTRLEGATLEEDVSRAAEGWSEERSAAIQLLAMQLLAALAAAHDNHIFHCDVKPQNAMITPSGLVLFDFGAARPEESLARTVTLVPYTPGYAAPELQSPYTIKDVGPWSDLYGWAMTVYGLVLGHDQSGVPVDALQRAMRKEDPYGAASVNLQGKGFPATWASAVAACLAIRHDDRPKSVAAVARMLGEDIDSALRKPITQGSLFAVPLQTAENNAAIPLAHDGDASGNTEKAPRDNSAIVAGRNITVPDVIDAGNTIVAPQRRPLDPDRGRPPPMLFAIAATLIVGLLVVRNCFVPTPPSGSSGETATSGAPFTDVSGEPVVPGTPASRPGVGCKDYEVPCDGRCQRKNDPDWGCGSCKTCKLDNARKITCIHTNCSPEVCADGWGNCDTNAANGCETHIAIEPANCGACANSCKKGVHVASLTCESGHCKITACEDSFLDCNGDPTDGCEIDTSSDVNRCGNCTTVCATSGNKVTGAICQRGVCRLQCLGSFLDCNGSSSDGCETDKGADPTLLPSSA